MYKNRNVILWALTFIIIILIIIFSKPESQEIPCSDYANTIIEMLPARCFSYFNIK